MEEEKSGYFVPWKRKEIRVQTETLEGLKDLIKDLPDNLFLCVVLEGVLWEEETSLN